MKHSDIWLQKQLTWIPINKNSKVLNLSFNMLCSSVWVIARSTQINLPKSKFSSSGLWQNFVEGISNILCAPWFSVARKHKV